MVRRASLAGVAAIAAAAVGWSGVAPAAADPAPAAGSRNAEGAASGPVEVASLGTDAPHPASRPGANDTKKVTLITGDQVWLTRVKDSSGKTAVSTRVVPAKRPSGAEVSFTKWGSAEEFYVVPSDVAPLLGTRVDRRLFDVAGLIDSGTNEASATPVIVEYKGSSGPTLETASRAVTERVGATKATVLASANSVALTVPAGRAKGLFDQVEAASSGASFVWLDAPVKALDTTSMPQIGATKAWKSGYTGKGIKVAVLDTGIDATHPDLRGQVAVAKNFSDSDSTTDRAGHGTHVASIVAGTGKAGGPGMRGVAYQAKLLNAKVLNDEGGGRSSDVIKGMEWAVKNGADVVNMSLGGGPGDGTDPVEKSVNSLSKKYDAVFAIAAGNGGDDRRGGVTTPSTADAAISVAAVDSKNRVASFSDTGPRRRNLALKPDVAGPGVDILGARSTAGGGGKKGEVASGASPYVAESGTSMAAPHVAGAAALLAQARPDLKGQELKSALMGGASDRTGTVWQEGAGVVNIPGSLAMRVIAREGSLSFGQFAYPQTKLKPVTKTLHYRNTSGKPVTLKLAADVRDAAGTKARGVSLSTTSLTVPAKGIAAARVTVNPAANPGGMYAGAVTATPSSGHAIRTTLGWSNETQRFNVTIKAIDRNGKPARVYQMPVFDVRDSRNIFKYLTFTGQATVKLPPGTYYTGAFLRSRRASGSKVVDEVLAVEPEFTVKADATMTLDGRKARRLAVKTPKPSTTDQARVIYVREDAAKTVQFEEDARAVGGKVQVWATPTKPVTIGRSTLTEYAHLIGPGTRPTYDYHAAFYTKNRIPASLSHRVTSKQVATVRGTYRSPIPGASGVVTWIPSFPGQFDGVFGSRKVTMPTTATTYLVGDGATWKSSLVGPRKGAYEGNDWSEFRGRRYAPGTSRNVDFLTGVFSPGAVSFGGASRLDDDLYAGMPLFEDSVGRGTEDYLTPAKTSMTAYIDGRKVGAEQGTEIRVPAGTGKQFKLVQRVDRKNSAWKTSTSTTGEWTAPISQRDGDVLPLMNVQYGLPGQSMTGTVRPGRQTLGLSVTAFINSRNLDTRAIAAKNLTLEYSVNGGKTWTKAKVERKGTRARAIFTPPTPKKGAATMVSLRAFASDGKGSTVRETIISAYQVRG